MDTMIHHLDAMEQFVHDNPSFRLVNFVYQDSVELQFFRYRFFSDTVPHNALRNRIYQVGRPDGGYIYSEDVKDLLGFYGYTMADLLHLREIMNAAGCFVLSHYWYFPQTDRDVMQIDCHCLHDTIHVHYTKSYWRPDPSVIELNVMDTVRGWTVSIWD